MTIANSPALPRSMMLSHAIKRCVAVADWLEPTQSAFSPTGDYHTWPEQWAIDSVQQAQKAYRDIEFAAAGVAGQRLRITIQLPSDYVDENQAIAAQQLAKAGFRLAELLNAIRWQ